MQALRRFGSCCFVCAAVCSQHIVGAVGVFIQRSDINVGIGSERPELFKRQLIQQLVYLVYQLLTFEASTQIGRASSRERV